MPCGEPVDFLSIAKVKSVSEIFLKPGLPFPNNVMGSVIGLVTLIFLFYLGSVELGRQGAYSFGVSNGITTVIVFISMMVSLSNLGIQCSIYAFMLLYLIVYTVITMLPAAANVPVLDQIPGTQRPADQISACRRLVACETSPMYKNHTWQKQKYDTCESCLSQNKGFKQNDDASGHVCTDAPPGVVTCSIDSSSTSCMFTRAALSAIGRSDDVQAVCTSAAGKLSWFDCSSGNCKGYIGDIGSTTLSVEHSPLGYPTKDICETTTGNVCTECTSCTAVDTFNSNCVCDIYKNNRQYKDPCAFLYQYCDRQSIAYTEAQIALAQANVQITDVVSTDDIIQFTTFLDQNIQGI